MNEVTERLYYADAYRARFSGRVVEALAWEGRSALVLDRTAFYPASGGQPADGGTLDELEVADVVVREDDGAIIHVLSEEMADLSRFGEAEVEGEIDWARRFDHMQQHTGQHVLSAAFERVLDADTVGFHLGAEVSTVDLDVARLDPQSVPLVEELANRVVWEDRPVHTRFVDPADVSALNLRRPPTVEGPLRIVQIAGPARESGHSFDASPCGGTHVARTGEIGLVKIVRLDYRGDETRVEFLCGGRALRNFEAKNEMIHRLTGMLTVGYWELDQAVERLQDEAKGLRRDLRRARERLLSLEAAGLAEAAARHGPYRVVCRVWEPEGESPAPPPGELRALAQELAQRLGVVALLVGIGERAHLCFACPEALDLDVASWLRHACARLGGKGGGRPHLAQGSAPQTDPVRIETVLSEQLSSLNAGSPNPSIEES